MANLLRKDKCLLNVLHGELPYNNLSKMSAKRLEVFVLKLVKYSDNPMETSVQCNIGGKPQTLSDFLNNVYRPKWWPQDHIFEKHLLITNRKYFRQSLRFLVIKCCEFFKHYYYSDNWIKSEWGNDENNCKGVKRKFKYYDDDERPRKKRMLVQKNNVCLRNRVNTNCTAYLKNLLITDNSPLKTVGQTEFLKQFDLSHATDSRLLKTSEKTSCGTSVKLMNCSKIPLSSDLGKLLILKEGHNFTTDLQLRKLERLERYLSNIPSTSKTIEDSYEVTYQERKIESHSHFYNFPKRQYRQFAGNTHAAKCLLRFCRPLTIKLVNHNLEAFKKDLDSTIVKTVEQKSSAQQLNKFVCRTMKINLLRCELVSHNK